MRTLVQDRASPDALGPLVRHSPIGVLVGLEVAPGESRATTPQKHRLAEGLPDELQAFRDLSKKERALAITGSIP